MTIPDAQPYYSTNNSHHSVHTTSACRVNFERREQVPPHINRGVRYLPHTTATSRMTRSNEGRSGLMVHDDDYRLGGEEFGLTSREGISPGYNSSGTEKPTCKECGEHNKTTLTLLPKHGAELTSELAGFLTGKKSRRTIISTTLYLRQGAKPPKSWRRLSVSQVSTRDKRVEPCSWFRGVPSCVCF